MIQEDKPILTGVDFSMEKGEFVFLIGRTGGGKSSLLKTIYADLPLKEGEMRVAGYDIKNIKPREIPLLRRKLGIIFQDFQLFSDRSVAENLFFVLKATGWKDKTKMSNRVNEVLMQVGLGSFQTKFPHQLSGGEQQRVVIARALLNEPQLLVADEPTGNLDPEVSMDIFNLFQEINNSGTAILMATHDFQLMEKFDFRTLKCENGRLTDMVTQ
ncbi:MAG: ATP-binding cassette domain-containing protein [Cyclobacteriaceae bacterium]|nr:ATP-binding cassette domain-containing protein [Cyclobacteriaceae bacterium]